MSVYLFLDIKARIANRGDGVPYSSTPGLADLLMQHFYFGFKLNRVF